MTLIKSLLFRSAIVLSIFMLVFVNQAAAFTDNDFNCAAQGDFGGTCFYQPCGDTTAQGDLAIGSNAAGSASPSSSDTDQNTVCCESDNSSPVPSGNSAGITIDNQAAESAAKSASTGSTNVGYALYNSSGNLLANYNDNFENYGGSITKSMLLVAYLDQVGAGTLSSDAKSELTNMIENSDNASADWVYNHLQNPDKSVEAVASSAGMSGFKLSSQGDSVYYLGQSQITANDFAKFFSKIDTMFPASQKSFALGLLSNLSSSDQVGLLQAGLPGTVYSKEGWRPEPGQLTAAARSGSANPFGNEGAPYIVNQAAQFSADGTTYGVAVTVGGAADQKTAESIIKKVVSALVVPGDNGGAAPGSGGDSSNIASGGPVVNDPSTKPGQSLGGVDGTGFTQAEINQAVAANTDKPSFNGAKDFYVTTYGSPWGGQEGGGSTSTGLDLSGPSNNQGKPRYEIAVDPSIIPYGSLVTVWPNALNWKGPFLAADTGGDITGHHVDVYDWTGDGTKNTFSAQNGTVEPYTGTPSDTGSSGADTETTNTQCCPASGSSSTGTADSDTSDTGSNSGSWSSGLQPPYIVEEYAVNVLEDLAQKKGKPSSDAVTPQHVLALVAWAQLEGGDIENSDLYNLYNTTLMSSDLDPTMQSTNSPAYGNFDDGVEATARTLASGHSTMAGTLLDPNSTAADFAHAESYSGTTPGTAEWAQAAVDNPSSYYQDTWLPKIQLVKSNYKEYASYVIGTSALEQTTDDTAPDKLSSINADLASSGSAGASTDSGCSEAGSQSASSIVQEALKLAWPEPFGDQKPGSEPTRTSALTNTQAYQDVLNQIWGSGSPPYGGADCGSFVAAVMRGSGADPNYPLSFTGAQWTYVLNHPKLYDVQQNVTSVSQLQPGDILIVGGPNGAGGLGHTWIYVGNQPGGYISASASGGGRSGNLTNDDLQPRNGYGYLRARLKSAET